VLLLGFTPRFKLSLFVCFTVDQRLVNCGFNCYVFSWDCTLGNTVVIGYLLDRRAVEVQITKQSSLERVVFQSMIEEQVVVRWKIELSGYFILSVSIELWKLSSHQPILDHRN
jgi:hypothetical protein